MAASDLKWACRAAHAGVTGYLGTPFNEDQLCPAIGDGLEPLSGVAGPGLGSGRPADATRGAHARNGPRAWCKATAQQRASGLQAHSGGKHERAPAPGRDTEIGGRRVPKGALVLLDIYSMQRRADYFPRPAAFDPERFSPEREKTIPRNAYQPFGSGPRSCIGRPFALMEGHLVLATIAGRVRLERTDTTRIAPKAALTLRPRRPVVLRIRAED